MENVWYFVSAIGALAVGFLIGFLFKELINKKKNLKEREEIEKALLRADSEAKEILLNARNEAIRLIEEGKREEQRKREHLEKLEDKVLKKEEQFEQKLKLLETKKEELTKKHDEILLLKEEALKLKEEQAKELEKISQLSREEAKKMLFKEVEESCKEEIVRMIQKAEQDLKAQSRERAKFIIADAIQKYAAETATESTVTVVSLSSDDMKGRIIGKEGRNINAFEEATGVDVIIDDNQSSIVLSGFDLVRRYIAKVALEKLLQDGRIHPARIEEVVEKTKEEVGNMIRELGERAAYEVGVAGLHQNLIKLLGRLKFRTSFGQNVLKHSIEVSFLASSIAAELGADTAVCKKAGLLHDIGKAVDHEVQGHHAVIGKDICKKFDLSEAVLHAIEAHEGEIEPKTLEAMIVRAANLIANARPGAQRDNLENHIKRMEEIENVVNSFEGVKSCYAVQAGSEVVAFVDPDKVDDLSTIKLAFEIARKLEKDMQYPGQVKIFINRETRSVSFAK